jgi:hypothetical protein
VRNIAGIGAPAEQTLKAPQTIAASVRPNDKSSPVFRLNATQSVPSGWEVGDRREQREAHNERHTTKRRMLRPKIAKLSRSTRPIEACDARQLAQCSFSPQTYVAPATRRHWRQSSLRRLRPRADRAFDRSQRVLGA